MTASKGDYHRVRAVASPWAAISVWGLWALLLVADLAFVARYGRNVPFIDDWCMVPVLTGAEPVTVNWLWEQFNEHRYPLAKLTLLCLYRATGCDFRAGMIWNVLALGIAAFTLILAARKVRGRTSYADAFFPLVLLHWGHCGDLLWSTEVCFLLPTLFVSALLAVIVNTGNRIEVPMAIGAGLCLAMLPLCGAVGLAYVPALALWFAYAGIRRPDALNHAEKWARLSLLASALLSVLLVGVYFLGYEPPAHHAPSAGPWASVRTSVQFMSIGLGPPAEAFWPLSGWLVLGIEGLGVAVLVRSFQRWPADRLRTLGLLAFAGATASLALGLGWGRSGWGEQSGFLPRYVTLAVPGLMSVYFTGVVCRLRVGGALQAGLLLLAAVLFPLNLKEGLGYGWTYRQQAEEFARDLRAGLPPFALAEYHYRFLCPWSKEEMAEYLRMLHQANIGPFQSMQDDPTMDEISVPVRPATVTRMSWHEQTWRGNGADSALEFSLEHPKQVYAIRLTCSYDPESDSSVAIRVLWTRRDTGTQGSVVLRRRFGAQAPLDDPTVTVWVNDTIDHFRIYPDDKPFGFRLQEIILLVPPPGDGQATGGE
jgi:hypothetical protein